MNKFFNYVKSRFNALSNDESGMEAAQVILILALVLLGLIPIVKTIIGKAKDAGGSAASCVDTTTSGC